MEKQLRSVEAMRDFAHTIAGTLSGGQALLLVGELGSGKTTFVQAFGRALGVKGAITSPTFTIAAHYPVPGHVSIKELLHIDLYRLENTDPLIPELLQQATEPYRLTVIEWADRLKVAVPNSRKLFFTVGENPTERQVRVE